MTMDAMECMGRQALACFVGTVLTRLRGEHKYHFSVFKKFFIIWAEAFIYAP